MYNIMASFIENKQQPLPRVNRIGRICTSPVRDIENQLSIHDRNIDRLDNIIFDCECMIAQIGLIIEKEEAEKKIITNGIGKFSRAEGSELSNKIKEKVNTINSLKLKITDLQKYITAFSKELEFANKMKEIDEKISTLKITDFNYKVQPLITEEGKSRQIRWDKDVTAYNIIQNMYTYFISFYDRKYKPATSDERKLLDKVFENIINELENNIKVYIDYTIEVEPMKEKEITTREFLELEFSAKDQISELMFSSDDRVRKDYINFGNDFIALYKLYNTYDAMTDNVNKREFYIQQILTPITQYKRNIESLIDISRTNGNEPITFGGKKKKNRKTKRKQNATNKKTKKVRKTKKTGKKSRK